MNNDIYVRDWIANCPSMQNDFARQKGVAGLEYGIYPSMVRSRYHENVLGELIADEIQEAMFILTAKMRYKDTNATRYSFYQDVIDWIEEQNKNANFPRLNEGIVRSVNARLAQYVSEPNKQEERSEVQIRFTYKRFNL